MKPIADSSASQPSDLELWQKTVHRSQTALECGALQSIETDYEFIEDAGIPFLVRILTNLRRKEEDKQRRSKQQQKTGQSFNPFLPYDEDLFVSHLSDTHLCLLNKYNVVEHHLLIVTRAFEEQENWLTMADFAAMWQCLQQIDGLVFYNGGAAAGASQKHKHLQLLPFPIAPDGVRLPIETAINTCTKTHNIQTLAPFQFSHSLAFLDLPHSTSPVAAATILSSVYQKLLHSVGLLENPAFPDAELGKPLGQQTGAYNLLATRQWMLIIPRSQEKFQSISVNSLGFAGTLLVRDREQLSALKQLSPLHLLQQVATPIAP